MVNYDAILYLVSIVLVLLILFMILFGCKSNGRHYYEKFTDKEDNLKDQENEREDEQEEGKMKKPIVNQEQKKNKEEPYLSNFENKILNELSTGQLTTEAFTNLIANQQFTQTNLENMINYVEYNKGSLVNN